MQARGKAPTAVHHGHLCHGRPWKATARRPPPLCTCAPRPPALLHASTCLVASTHAAMLSSASLKRVSNAHCLVCTQQSQVSRRDMRLWPFTGWVLAQQQSNAAAVCSPCRRHGGAAGRHPSAAPASRASAPPAARPAAAAARTTPAAAGSARTARPQRSQKRGCGPHLHPGRFPCHHVSACRALHKVVFSYAWQQHGLLGPDQLLGPGSQLQRRRRGPSA